MAACIATGAGGRATLHATPPPPLPSAPPLIVFATFSPPGNRAAPFPSPCPSPRFAASVGSPVAPRGLQWRCRWFIAQKLCYTGIQAVPCRVVPRRHRTALPFPSHPLRLVLRRYYRTLCAKRTTGATLDLGHQPGRAARFCRLCMYSVEPEPAAPSRASSRGMSSSPSLPSPALPCF